VPGLRTEEVAQLVGLTVRAYERIERGERSTSIDSLRRIAEVFGISPGSAEYRYFFRLAGHHAIGLVPARPEPENADLQRLVDGYGSSPAYLVDWRMDLVVWNQAVCAVYVDIDALPKPERNIMRMLYTSADLRARLVNWEMHAQRVLAQFRDRRSYCVDDLRAEQLIRELTSLSLEFRRWWGEQRVTDSGDAYKQLDHPGAGRLVLHQSAWLALGGEPTSSLVLVLATPVAGTGTDEKLNKLLRARFAGRRSHASTGGPLDGASSVASG
jgi:transcriptional regulator with XRE-family HTH domain